LENSTIPTIPPLIDKEDEALLRSSVAKFCQEQIAPKVRQMDEKSELDKGLLKALFDQGLMGIEIPTQYKGS